jgi:nucleoside-diphosphate-sugar epimerase
MEEALVIGGSGFLGRHVVRLLRDSGRTVRVFSRSADAQRTSDSGIRYVTGDIADAAAVSAAVDGVQVVFDLATCMLDTWEEMRRTYVEGARNVAQACLQHGVRRLVYTSTTAVLDFSLDSSIDESAGTDKRAHERPGSYHRSKIAAETLLRDLHASTGLPVVILRPALIMGRGGKLCHSGIGTWRDDTCALIIGKGTHPLPFVLAQDVAQAAILAMSAPGVEGKTFNLAGDVRPSALQMIQHMRERSLRNFRAYPKNVYKAYVIAKLRYIIKNAVGSPADSLSLHAWKSEQVRTQLDCSAAKRLLGWTPVADQEIFLREAVDPHLRPVHPGDLRLTGSPSPSGRFAPALDAASQPLSDPEAIHNEAATS